MRISDWSSDVCSSDLVGTFVGTELRPVVLVVLTRRVRQDLEVDVQHVAAECLGLAVACLHDAFQQARERRRIASEDSELTSTQLTHPDQVLLIVVEERAGHVRSEEHTSELQSLMRSSYAV